MGQGALAAAGAPQNAQGGAGGDGEADVVEQFRVAGVGVVHMLKDHVPIHRRGVSAPGASSSTGADMMASSRCMETPALLISLSTRPMPRTGRTCMVR